MCGLPSRSLSRRAAARVPQPHPPRRLRRNRHLNRLKRQRPANNMDASRPIVITKKKGGHGGYHGGAWKVAYADFVTAMMKNQIELKVTTEGLRIELLESATGTFFDLG